MQIISSKDNELVKHIKKLKDKKYRDESNEYIIEGVKLIEEAVKEKAKIKKVIICEDTTRTYEIPTSIMYEIAKYECIYVTDKIFASITQVTNPQGIMAIIEKNDADTSIDYTQDIIVALDDVQDPGNLGTILRTVDSIGVNQIIVSKGTADAFNSKVVRSTMGAIFRVKIIETDNLIQTIKEIKKHINLKDRNVLWIDELVVDEKNRENGTGKVLFKEVMKIAKIKKCNFVELNCWNFNENAIKFYEKCEMKTQRNIMEIKVDI